MRVVTLVILLILITPLSIADPGADGLSVGQQWGEELSEVGLENLNGSGVVIAVADTGIDMDHSCFRDSETDIGEPGINHRKIVALNDSIDNWDTQGHQQFRHGTHVAGILACDPLDNNSDIKSMSYGSRLVVQDIVDSTGWSPPAVEELLAESSLHGAVINSWSWGDNTIDYTERSEKIDEWTVENPWSLIFIAPGNNGGMMLEPSNAYNVVSVAASDSEENASMWPSSSHGPDVNGRRGTFVSSPGVNILSAKADGVVASMNNGTHSMTGTSMAAPMAASFTALLQEMVEKKYGFTPSAPLLRTMLAASAEPVTGMSPDPIQGYGRPSLESFNTSFFIHDSYKVDDWVSIIQERGGTLDSLKNNSWNGSGAEGPFLSQNDTWSHYLSPIPGQDVEVTLSYNARPAEYDIDDLRLLVKTSDGRVAVDDEFTSSGYSQLYYQSVFTPLDHNSSNETTVMVRLSSEQLEDVDWIEIQIVAKSVVDGGSEGELGISGDRVGFGLTAMGVDELLPNNGPVVTMVSGPNGGENYTDNVTLELMVNDLEGDGVVMALRLVNQNYTVDLGDCAVALNSSFNSVCVVDVEKELIPRKVNRHDWRFEVVAVDDNTSFWTGVGITLFETENFTIWWVNPVFEEPDVWQPDIESKENKENNTLLWGILGVAFGALVAASVMFRRGVIDLSKGVKSPFREEE
jgi:hypothetical protein